MSNDVQARLLSAVKTMREQRDLIKMQQEVIDQNITNRPAETWSQI